MFAVFDFSGIYEEEGFYLDENGEIKEDIRWVDCRELTGCNCMCDDEAIEAIIRKIHDSCLSGNENGHLEDAAAISNVVENSYMSCFAKGLHFIDSGNYHYMSAILTGFIDESFSLVVLDHHPDMQKPMFGDILSCGGWVKEVLDKNPLVRDVHIYGASRELISQLPQEDIQRVIFYTESELSDMVLPETEYPIYLSIDKDVISRDEILTNWDQGNVSQKNVLEFIRRLLSTHSVIGTDICGECAKDQDACDISKAIEVNDAFNRQIVELLAKSSTI